MGGVEVQWVSVVCSGELWSSARREQCRWGANDARDTRSQVVKWSEERFMFLDHYCELMVVIHWARQLYDS